MQFPAASGPRNACAAEAVCHRQRGIWTEAVEFEPRFVVGLCLRHLPVQVSQPRLRLLAPWTRLPEVSKFIGAGSKSFVKGGVTSAVVILSTSSRKELTVICCLGWGLCIQHTWVNQGLGSQMKVLRRQYCSARD